MSVQSEIRTLRSLAERVWRKTGWRFTVTTRKGEAALWRDNTLRMTGSPAECIAYLERWAKDA